MPDKDPNVQSIIEQYRLETFYFNKNSRLISKRDAIRFVNKRGFVFFWPIREVTLPSLWGATAGNRPVPNHHDDPAHITWRWKDDLLNKRKWHYAKILRSKSTIISLDLLPFFYALSPNFGKPEEDVAIAFADGLIPSEQKEIFNVLSAEGALDTIQLRTQSGFSSGEKPYRFQRALSELQRDFRIMPIGIAEVGAWNYSFIYDLVHRYYPDLIVKSREITLKFARNKILKQYFNSVGAEKLSMIRKVFGWGKKEIELTLKNLFVDKFLVKIENPSSKEPIYILKHLINSSMVG